MEKAVIQAARRLAAEGKFQSALDILSAWPGTSGSCEARLLRGKILAQRGRYAEAIPESETIPESDAHRGDARQAIDAARRLAGRPGSNLILRANMYYAALICVIAILLIWNVSLRGAKTEAARAVSGSRAAAGNSSREGGNRHTAPTLGPAVPGGDSTRSRKNAGDAQEDAPNAAKAGSDAAASSERELLLRLSDRLSAVERQMTKLDAVQVAVSQSSGMSDLQFSQRLDKTRDQLESQIKSHTETIRGDMEGRLGEIERTTRSIDARLQALLLGPPPCVKIAGAGLFCRVEANEVVVRSVKPVFEEGDRINPGGRDALMALAENLHPFVGTICVSIEPAAPAFPPSGSQESGLAETARVQERRAELVRSFLIREGRLPPGLFAPVRNFSDARAVNTGASTPLASSLSGPSDAHEAASGGDIAFRITRIGVR